MTCLNSLVSGGCVTRELCIREGFCGSSCPWTLNDIKGSELIPPTNCLKGGHCADSWGWCVGGVRSAYLVFTLEKGEINQFQHREESSFAALNVFTINDAQQLMGHQISDDTVYRWYKVGDSVSKSVCLSIAGNELNEVVLLHSSCSKTTYASDPFDFHPFPHIYKPYCGARGGNWIFTSVGVHLNPVWWCQTPLSW